MYPNPVRGTARLQATLPAAATVRVALYDPMGRRVREYPIGARAAGTLDMRLDVDGLAAGTYVVRVQAGAFEAHRTIVVVR